MQIWILIVGGLVLLGIALDLVRRMRGAGRDSHEMDLNMQRGLGDYDPLSGGQAADDVGLTVGKSRRVEGQVGQAPAHRNTTKREPVLPTSTRPLDDTQKIRRVPTLTTTPKPESRAPTRDESPPGTIASNSAPKHINLEDSVPMLMESGDRVESSFDDDPLMSGAAPILSRPRVVPRTASSVSQGEQPDVLAFHIRAKAGQVFSGAALLEAIVGSGLRYGEMSIFHYYPGDDEEFPLFSLVNSVKPGIFDLNNMQSFQTPGVSIFMTLPIKARGAISAMDTFEKMLQCAKKIASALDGELRDESRNVLSGQTIEHYKQRISEFSRKVLSKSGKIITE